MSNNDNGEYRDRLRRMSVGKTAGRVYSRNHSYEDYLDYKNGDLKKESSLYQKNFSGVAENYYSKNGDIRKFNAEKPFKEEAARLNAEARKQEAERQQDYDGSSLGSNTLSRGETMLTGGEGVTLAENSRKRRSLLGG